jgi:hypothetical protein
VDFLSREDRPHLPDYPKVEARGDAVIIIEEDGEEHLWGYEDDASTAVAVAEDIQLGLRAIHYVRTSLLISLRETMEFLTEAGVPTEHLDDIIYEGYQSIHKWFNELEKRKTTEISFSC